MHKAIYPIRYFDARQPHAV